MSGNSVALDTSVAIALLAGQASSLLTQLWIAALCVEHRVPLATLDVRFDVVEGLARYAP